MRRGVFEKPDASLRNDPEVGFALYSFVEAEKANHRVSTHHSDRGSQYTSVEFGSRLKEAGILPSMGSVADAYDNALAESFVSTFKRELIHRHPCRLSARPRMAIFEYIEGFYNTRRRHSALGNLAPSEYEEVRLRGGAVA